SRRRHTRSKRDWSSDVCSSDLNYAQGSSREHAAIAPRYLGQRAVIAKSYARIGWQNLVNFGIPPLEFQNDADYEDIDQGDVLTVNDIRSAIKNGNEVVMTNKTKGNQYTLKHSFSDRQKERSEERRVG